MSAWILEDGNDQKGERFLRIHGDWYKARERSQFGKEAPGSLPVPVGVVH